MENEDIISKLKFLSRVQKGEKINVKGMFIQTDNIKTSVSRAVWNTDSRQNTLVFIETTINKTSNLIDTYLRSSKDSEKLIGGNMVKDMILAKDGISHLKTTYNDDTMFCAKIDTFVEIIDAKLAGLKAKHKELFSDSENENESVEVNETETF